MNFSYFVTDLFPMFGKFVGYISAIATAPYRQGLAHIFGIYADDLITIDYTLTCTNFFTGQIFTMPTTDWSNYFGILDWIIEALNITVYESFVELADMFFVYNSPTWLVLFVVGFVITTFIGIVRWFI